MLNLVSVDLGRSNRCRRGCLLEVLAHVPLEVKVGELIRWLERQESCQLGIGVDLATILLVLELVCANVGIDLTSDISTSNQSTLGLREELGQLVTDQGWLDKSAWGTNRVALLSLVSCLLDCLEFTLRTLLESSELEDESRHLLAHQRELSGASRISVG